MFNFKFQQRAFEELNAEQFRIVYLLNSTLSMINKTNKTPKNHKLEMFNSYLMDKLGLKERMVQYHIKTLEQKGYIKVKRPIGRNVSKQPNIITLNFEENNAIDCTLNNDENNAIDCTLNNDENNAINDAINCAIDCTLNKNTKENKIYNISKDFSTYSNSTCREKDITKWTKVFNENNNLKENEMSDNGTSVMNEKRNEVERNEDNFKEVIISKAIGNINLDKSSMFEAKSQMEYDAALEDLKLQLKKIQDNTSTEAYNNFRTQLGKWFNASKPYMKFAQSKKKKVNAAPAPTDEEMGKLEWFVEGVKVSKTIEETDKYFNKIDHMFEILYGKYAQNTVDKLYERTTNRLSEYKRTNPIVAEYIKNVTGEPQTIEVDKLSTNDEKTRQNASKYPQIEEESNMDMCCETKVA